MFVPFQRMSERIEIARSDSDTTLFYDLVSFGEMVAKFTVAGLLATIGDDRSRSRYRHAYKLVRASSIGDWDDVAEDILFGTASQHIVEQARAIQKDLTQKYGGAEWQRRSVTLLHECLRETGVDAEALPIKTNARTWLKLFARFRNKIYHGSPGLQSTSALSGPLEESIKCFADNAQVFQNSWAFLHRNLSGKYRVVPLSPNPEPFDPLRRANTEQYIDGVYVYLDRPRRVELVFSDADLTDIAVANGGFTTKRFEALSYTTGATSYKDSAEYLSPADELPSSRTHGFGDLEVRGDCLSNAPPPETEYVSRTDLERQLTERLVDRELHRLITLHGRGGAGKTSLALQVIDSIAASKRYDTIVWFSARDIDLLTDGPKPVKPQVFTTKEIAREFVRLVDGTRAGANEALQAFGHALGGTELGPTLFVFDNFETVENPPEAYTWIDTYLRHPNKALITTRHREFKGDYPIEVDRMSEQEADELITRQAKRLGVGDMITSQYKEELYRESDGQPYVLKILLGEVARNRRAVAVERIIADRDEMLTALFERTYAKLSPAAQRVFLTLCGWRATVPVVAVQAALLRSAEERFDVEAAVDELVRYSFVELLKAASDNSYFLAVPLTAAAFGKKKLAVSAVKSSIDADLRFLHMLGPAQRDEVRRGIGPRIERMLNVLSDGVAAGTTRLSDHLRVLQFFADKYPPVWLWLSEMFEDVLDMEHAIDYVRRYLEGARDGRLLAWRRLAELCRKTDDSAGEMHALVGMSEEGVEVGVVSAAANRVNQLFWEKPKLLDTDEKRMLLRRLVQLFEAVEDDASGTDLSRLAWLNLHLHDEDAARRYVKRGLRLEPHNTFLLSLARRLTIPVPHTA